MRTLCTCGLHAQWQSIAHYATTSAEEERLVLRSTLQSLPVFIYHSDGLYSLSVQYLHLHNLSSALV